MVGTRVLLVLSLLPISLLAAEEKEQLVKTKLQGKLRTNRKHGYGNCQWLYPQANPVERVRLPMLKSKKPIFYEAKFGDGKDRSFLFVIDESVASNGYDTLYVDLNNDNVIQVDNEKFPMKLGSGSRDHPQRIQLDVTIAGQKVPYFVDFSAFKYRSMRTPNFEIHVNLRDSSYYVAEVDLNGTKTPVAILDLDTNGHFNDFERGKVFEGDRLLFDFNRDGQFMTRTDERNESFPYSRYMLVQGNWYQFKPTKDGRQLAVKKVDPVMGSVRTSLLVRKAVLHTRGQTLELEFQDGHVQALPGDYQVQRLILTPPGITKSRWSLELKRGAVKPRWNIKPGDALAVRHGEKLEIIPQVTKFKAGDRELQVDLSITDAEKTEYVLRTDGSAQLESGFAILDGEQRILFASTSSKWEIPSRYDGVYRIRPVIDITGLPYRSKDLIVRIKGGRVAGIGP